MNQEAYISNQFSKVLSTQVDEAFLPPHFSISMKVRSQFGETVWMDLSTEQFREIECILAMWESNHE